MAGYCERLFAFGMDLLNLFLSGFGRGAVRKAELDKEKAQTNSGFRGDFGFFEL